MPPEIKSMGIKILGSGTCVPSLKRSACSVLVQAGDENFLLDAGPGTMTQLLKAGVEIKDIDAVLLSHFHLDHSSELAAFIFASRYGSEEPRTRPLHILGGTGLTELYDTLNRAYNNVLSLPGSIIQRHELKTPCLKPMEFKNVSILHEKMNHNHESLAYRITSKDGFSMVYSGDTDISDNLIKFAEDADVLICESAFPDDQKVKGHLTPSLAGKIASSAGVRCLVLTHFYPECEKVDITAQCRKTYAGPLMLAEDMMDITRHTNESL